MWLLLSFIAIPIIEIALFVTVGAMIGLWWTLAIVFGSAFLGIWLLRNEGTHAVARIQKSLNENTDPAEPMVDTAMFLLAGILLIIPGFFTDAVGLLFLIPFVRRAAFRALRKRAQVQGFTVSSGGGMQGRYYEDSDVIEGEFTELDGPKAPTHRPSGWTQH